MRPHSDAAPPPSDIPYAPVSVSSPQTSEPYVDHGEIARGGMGAINHVTDPSLGRQMALKKLPPAGGRKEVSRRQRFVEEAQITGQLDHPNIVPVHQLGEDDAGAPYFTMKLVRGRTLADMLGEFGERRLEAENLEALLQIVIKVCDAVSFAHSRGVIHRDLKPSNLMVGSHGQVYVMDWGLALVRTGPRLVSDRGVLIGTPSYMAPEQAVGTADVIDPRTDVYGLGGILYRILTTCRPHPGRDKRSILRHVRYKEVAPPHEAVTGLELPPELCRITMRALAREPDDRYPTVDALRSDLASFLRGGGWLELRDIAAGELILQQGDDASEAYIIASGECEAFKVVGKKRIPLRTMGPGEVFGEMALLTGAPRSASVVAKTDVQLRVVTQTSLDRELDRNAWMKSFFRVLADRFREADAKLTDLRSREDD